MATAGDIIKKFRSLVDDIDEGFESDLLWDDTDVFSYLNGAVDDACTRAPLISDNSTPAVVNLALVSGTHTYSFHPSILRIDDIIDDSTSKSLVKTTKEEMDENKPAWRLDAANNLKGYMIDWPQKKVRFWEAPAATGAVTFEVPQRLPLTPLSSPTDVVEIPQEFTPGLIYGMAELAYLKADSEIYNANESIRFSELFTKFYGVRKSAQSELANRNHDTSRRGTRPEWL